MPTLATYQKPDGTTGYCSQTEGMFKIQFTEGPDGYSEDWLPGMRECQRLLRCRWNLRGNFQLDMIGQANRNPDGTIQRWIPERHPDIPGMYCVGMKLLRGKGRPSIDYLTTLCRFLDDVPAPQPEPDRPDQNPPRSPVVGYAEFAAIYQRLAYLVLRDEDIARYGPNRESQRFTSRVERTASESITLPAAAFRWVPNGDPLPQGPIKVFYTREVIFTWHKVPSRNRTSIDNCLGRVNKLTFDGCDPGTVLFLGPSRLEIDPSTISGAIFDPVTQQWTASALYTHDYSFLYRKQGWNKFFRKTAGGGSFQDFSIDGTASTADGNRLIDEIDLYNLWNLKD